MNYQYEDEDDVREAFWASMPMNVRLRWYATPQNKCPADVRCAFVDYVDYLQKSGQITDKLADQVTL